MPDNQDHAARAREILSRQDPDKHADLEQAHVHALLFIGEQLKRVAGALDGLIVEGLSGKGVQTYGGEQ